MKGDLETSFVKNGRTIIGVDEVGRGCLAGPVFACCLALDYEKLRRLKASDKDLIRDSKKLSSGQRKRIIPVIMNLATEYYVAKAHVLEIETLGICDATFLAMQRAISQCRKTYDTLLIDGNRELPSYSGHQQAIVSGDNLCFCISAASIIAKETRDLYMIGQSVAFPQYGFERHVGYGTKLHQAMIDKYGICPLHRRTFAPINRILAIKGKTDAAQRK